VRLARALSLGVAVERWTGSARTTWQDREAAETSVATSDGEATQEYRGFGVRLGALVQVSKRLRLAAVGRLPFKMNDEQTSSWHLARDPWTRQLDLRRSGQIDWPATFGFGVATRPVDRLDVALDVIVGQWSKGVYTNSYDSTATTTYLGDPHGPQSVHLTGDTRLLWPTPVGAAGAAANERQADTFQVRLGTEYRLRVSRAISLPLRAGGVFDRQLTREADAKPVRGIGATAGLGLAAPHFSLDVAWVLGTSKVGVDGASEKLPSHV
jgi:long-subunit fatty acid transport protein